MAQVAGIGEWKSPVTSELMTSKALRLASTQLEADGKLYWLETRPSEGGRQVLVQRTEDGTIRDVSPPPESGINVRTRVHEYGGGDFTIAGDVAVFSNFSDQRVYTQSLTDLSQPPSALTAADQGLRFADYEYDAGRSRVLCVCETHGGDGSVVNSLVAIDLSNGVITTLASGHDFYSNPRLGTPDSDLQTCQKLAWLQWDFPNMPWDGSELCLADITHDGTLAQFVKVAGGPEESVQQPQWDSRAHRLYFISDRTGWWNLYAWDVHHEKVRYICGMDAEFGVPTWSFGTQTYAVLRSGHLLAVYNDPQAGTTLGLIRPPSKPLHEDRIVSINWGFSSFSRFCVWEEPLAGGGGRLVISGIGATLTSTSAVVELAVASVLELPQSTPSDWRTIKQSAAVTIDEGYLSAPRTIEFPTTGGLTAFLNFYPPRNQDYALPEGVLPPLLVKSHGGPTAAATSALSLVIQYWTSRGFAVADVDYGGSTGYGRKYRNRLRGMWGVVDVDDCTNAAKYLAQQGLVDGKRLCIDGVSAGGYTTLACLAFRDAFAAGASLYGVSDLETLAKDTHKFESRYLDSLVGPYPDARDLYVARSPIHNVQGFKAPIIFFQGTDDKVVLPEQAVTMHSAIQAGGIPTSLTLFPGEGHGFRGADAIRGSIDGELFFYGRVLGFPVEMPDGVPQPVLDNLDAAPPPAKLPVTAEEAEELEAAKGATEAYDPVHHVAKP